MLWRGFAILTADGCKVKGTDEEIARLLAACTLALEKRGYDIDHIAKELKNLKPKSSVRSGRWLPTNDDNKKRCNQCDVIHLIAQYPHGQANYCPNCGAKMDLKNEAIPILHGDTPATSPEEARKRLVLED